MVSYQYCRASALIELGVVVYTVEQGLNEETEFITCTHLDINERSACAKVEYK